MLASSARMAAPHFVAVAAPAARDEREQAGARRAPLAARDGDDNRRGGERMGPAEEPGTDEHLGRWDARVATLMPSAARINSAQSPRTTRAAAAATHDRRPRWPNVSRCGEAARPNGATRELGEPCRPSAPLGVPGAHACAPAIAIAWRPAPGNRQEARCASARRQLAHCSAPATDNR